MKISNPAMSTKGKNWNAVTGCSRYSSGCRNCYAMDEVRWLEGMGREPYVRCGFKVTAHEDRLDLPLRFPRKPKQPYRSFVTDMGDLFHPEISDDFICRVFETMLQVPQHRFYVVTKRAERLAEIGPRLPWRPWVWAGVTVESARYLARVDQLRKLPPEVNKFILMEPLLSDMPKLDLKGIRWVIVGGETNKECRFRPMMEAWVVNVRDQVKAAGLPFLFKHWEGRSQNSREALLEGRRWEEYPADLLG